MKVRYSELKIKKIYLKELNLEQNLKGGRWEEG
jgi:hypothetical protein